MSEIERLIGLLELAEPGCAVLPMPRGFFALIDAEDFELVSQYKWRSDVRSGRRGLVYAATGSSPNVLYMHRLVLGLPKEDPRWADHRDGNGLNNRRSNLRIATPAQNNANARKQAGSSQFKGVTWFTPRMQWRAQIQVNGRKKHLGLFADELAAAHAYDDAARAGFGEFARTNF